MADQNTEVKAKIPLLTKKKYKTFKDFLDNELDKETSDMISAKYCEIMEFNPDASTYDKFKGKAHDKWRKNKVIELGISLRQINNQSVNNSVG